MGYPAVFGAHARNQHGYVSDSPANRASDLHELFLNPEAGAILAAIGGDHACHLLPLLDFGLIREHPKIFCGYSDITVLNIAFYVQSGLVTFNGPALLVEFAEFPEMDEYSRENWLNLVVRPEPAGQILPSAWWTEEMLEWGSQKDLTRPRIRQPSQGWTWLKDGTAEGVLIGGCIESLEHLRGTRFWPDWEEAIFFFETSEEKPSPARVDSILMDYENMGVFERLGGMLVGRPMYYNGAEKQELRQVLLERTAKYDFPILSDMDFGHTTPMLTLPIGVRARIDTPARRFEILEAAVS
jgi:muramoyltetrapeptide carboxypeptidase LdcA involved in peptidoglycan recycling